MIMKILIIEDNYEFRSQLDMYLTHKGYDVLLAGDVDSGLQLCSQEKVDVVLTDIFMPGKIGLDAIREIRHSYSNIAIIAMSGGDIESHINLLPLTEKMGSIKALSKPFDFSVLVAIIDDVSRLAVKSGNKQVPETLFDISLSCFLQEITDNDAMNEFIEQFDKDAIDSLLLSLETALTTQRSDKDDCVQETFRSIHNLKGTACFLKLDPVIMIAKYMEECLCVIRNHIHEITGVKDNSLFDVMFMCIDSIELMIQNFRAGSTVNERPPSEMIESCQKICHFSSLIKDDVGSFFCLEELNVSLF